MGKFGKALPDEERCVESAKNGRCMQPRTRGAETCRFHKWRVSMAKKEDDDQGIVVPAKHRKLEGWVDHKLCAMGIPLDDSRRKIAKRLIPPKWKLWFCSCGMWGDRWDCDLPVRRIKKEHAEHVRQATEWLVRDAV